MSLQADSLRDQLQHRLDGAFPSSRCPYDKVAALILYWLEDDFNPSCAKEAEKVVELFKKDFQYETQVFPIPSLNAQSALEQTVSTFKYHNEPKSYLESNLLIVYYSGHGDPDIDREKAVWAAKSFGEPTLDWFLIQPMLLRTQADVLLIFDCCYASLAGKGREPGSRVDLLAAAPDGGTTPCPGPYSFTQFFVDATRRGLAEDLDLQVSNISNLVHKRSKQTPVCLPLRAGRENSTSIVLRPLLPQYSAPLVASDGSRAVGGAFSFTITVNEPPNEQHVRQLGEWIKTSAPRTISTVKVDSVIDLSNSLREFVLEEGKAGVKGRFIDSLSDDDKARIISGLCNIGKVVASTRRDTPAAMECNRSDQMLSSGASVLRAIEERTLKLSRVVWRVLTNHPAYQSSTDLENLEQNSVAQHAGVSAAARMSLLAKDLSLGSGLDALYIPRGKLRLRQLVKSKDQLMIGTFEGQPVIVEIIRSSGTDQQYSPDILKTQLKKIYALLANQKPDYFRILRCMGFCCEEKYGWYGLVFELPEEFHKPIRLRDLFGKTPRVSLEIRYSLAYTVALALGGLHSVHWVHKGIRSENILFFTDMAGSVHVRHHEPWLFGFENTREDSEGSSKQADYRLGRRIYFPPSRWGTPSEKFSYKHDVYALGVLLLEIGLWTYALQLDKSGFQSISTPEEAQTLLMGRSGLDISHAMGSKYSTVVLACLSGKGGEGQDDKLDFQRDVLDVLEGLCKCGTLN